MEMNTTLILYMLALLAGSFALTYLLLPKIIGVVTFRGLTDNPVDRSSHINQIPSLGGIAFFISLILGLSFIQYWDDHHVTMSIIPGLLILFIVGLKDDLVILSPLTKIGAQLIAIVFAIQHPVFHIYELNGFLGVEQISFWITMPLVVFLMLTIINAINLLDGIDGLASTVSIIILTLLGAMFFWLHIYFFSGICVLMVGSLLAFLPFNLSNKRKIFMGDTGSLVIGFVIAICIVRLFAIPQIVLRKLPFQLENLPLIIMAILVVPFFDTARVVTIRLMNKKTPFSPDRSHIHHLLIDYLKLSHRKASFLIAVVNVLFISIFLVLGAVVSNWKLLIVFLVLTAVFVFIFYRMNSLFIKMKRHQKIVKRAKGRRKNLRKK